jgi:hypothetical protein
LDAKVVKFFWNFQILVQGSLNLTLKTLI